jgi:putrescine importer
MSTIDAERARSVEEPSQPQQLQKDAIGLSGAMILGVVIMAPSLAIFTNWGFMIPTVGRGTAVVFVIALIMSLPTAYSYALINSRMPSAGATYKWASRLISPYIGIAMGLCTTLFYAFVIPYTLPAIGLLGTDLARNTSTGLFAVLMGGSLLLALPLVYRGINVNVDASVLLVIAEVIILAVIAVGAFFASSDSHASLTPLNPGEIPSTSALIPALVLGVLSFTGYDAISTVAEETRTPRRLIPKATILAVLLVGLFWIVMSTILSDTLTPAAYTKVIDEGGFPLAAAAEAAFGSGGRYVIDIMGLEASFALLIASSIGATRILYAMGRDGVIDRRFGHLHPRFKVPWFGVTTVLVFAVVADVLVSIYLGLSYNVGLWLSNLIVFFALVTYLAINVCNPLLVVRHFRSEFHWFSNGLVPIAGIGVTGYFMYKGFFQVLWDGEFKTGRSVVLTALILLAATGVAAWAIGRQPDRREAARRGADEGELDAGQPSPEVVR